MQSWEFYFSSFGEISDFDIMKHSNLNKQWMNRFNYIEWLHSHLRLDENQKGFKINYREEGK
jgi:uncharacterized Zn-finger protein